MNSRFRLHTFQEHGFGHEDRSNIRIDGWGSHSPPMYIWFPRKRGEQACVQILEGKVNLSYYIGLDWIRTRKEAVQITPKVDAQNRRLDYVSMLFEALEESETLEEIEELFVIKFDSPMIEIPQQMDSLTPLLMIAFLKIVQKIVRKGLRRSYYSQERNLIGQIKGKVLISETLKRNTLRQKNLHTVCRYDTFGTDGLENRLIKKTLLFAKHYLDHHADLPIREAKGELFSYIMPAFAKISDEVSLREIKHTVFNPFYREYAEAIRLARLILRRFGYNLVNTEAPEKIATPPFWIDMSKLFELYVLKKLRETFGNEIRYQFHGYSGYPDFLLPSQQMVIDAKYKMNYGYRSNDIRQLSGYARDHKILRELGYPQNMSPDCLIVYPNQDEGKKQITLEDLRNQNIQQFHGFYRLGIQLPFISIKSEIRT